MCRMLEMRLIKQLLLDVMNGTRALHYFVKFDFPEID